MVNVIPSEARSDKMVVCKVLSYDPEYKPRGGSFPSFSKNEPEIADPSVGPVKHVLALLTIRPDAVSVEPTGLFQGESFKRVLQRRDIKRVTSGHVNPKRVPAVFFFIAGTVLLLVVLGLVYYEFFVSASYLGYAEFDLPPILGIAVFSAACFAIGSALLFSQKHQWSRIDFWPKTLGPPLSIVVEPAQVHEAFALLEESYIEYQFIEERQRRDELASRRNSLEKARGQCISGGDSSTKPTGSGQSAIEFQCDTCGSTLRVPQAMAGRDGKCRSCGAMVTAPKPLTIEDYRATVADWMRFRPSTAKWVAAGSTPSFVLTFVLFKFWISFGLPEFMTGVFFGTLYFLHATFVCYSVSSFIDVAIAPEIDYSDPVPTKRITAKIALVLGALSLPMGALMAIAGAPFAVAAIFLGKAGVRSPARATALTGMALGVLGLLLCSILFYIGFFGSLVSKRG